VLPSYSTLCGAVFAHAFALLAVGSSVKKKKGGYSYFSVTDVVTSIWRVRHVQCQIGLRVQIKYWKLFQNIQHILMYLSKHIIVSCI
jgi:hypothetical protein